MRNMALRITLVAFMLLPGFARGQERKNLADALAVQEAVHQAIERAEPSIACILVSRSEKYRAYTAALPEAPGRLGKFDLRSAQMRLPDTDPEFAALARLNLSDPNTVPEAYGSGVVLDERERLILTMGHVVRKATKVFVRLPGGRGSWADIHAYDARSDLAVLRLIDNVPDLKALKLGDGSKLRKGDFILSLSNPFASGFRDGSPCASWGIVSNLRRRAIGVRSDVPSFERNTKLPWYCFNTLIQTDTRMNLGCSGGALLNLQGELVGLTSALAGIAGGETPGGFAVPLDAGMKRILEVLRRGEEVEYGFLGVKLEDLAEGHPQVREVVAGGPAALAGIRGRGFPSRNGPSDGDFILTINGQPIHNNDELFLIVGMHLAGSTVRVEVASKPRDEERRFCSVTLAKFYSPLEPVIASKRPPARGGLRVDWTSTGLLLQRRDIPVGVLIREVVPGSAAETARLQPHMLITKVNQHLVKTPAEFYREMEKANGPVELTVAKPRGGEERVILESR